MAATVPITTAALLSLAATETERLRPGRLTGRRHGEDLILLQPAIEYMARVVDHAWGLGLAEVLRTRPPGYIAPESGLE